MASSARWQFCFILPSLFSDSVSTTPSLSALCRPETWLSVWDCDEQGPTHTYRRTFWLVQMCVRVCACVYVRACARGACRCGSMCVPMTHWAYATSHRTKTHENITAASPLSFCLPTAAILPVPPQPSPLFSSFLKVQAQSNQAGNESGRRRRSSKYTMQQQSPTPTTATPKKRWMHWHFSVATSEINMKLVINVYLIKTAL